MVFGAAILLFTNDVATPLFADAAILLIFLKLTLRLILCCPDDVEAVEPEFFKNLRKLSEGYGDDGVSVEDLGLTFRYI